MAQIKSVHKKRPPKKFQIPGPVVQWGIIGIVVAVVIFLVAGSLTRTPAEPPPIPMLSSAQRDLVSLTRMLGDVELDSAVRRMFPAGLDARLVGPDTLFEQKKWLDAIGQLDKLVKKSAAEDLPALRAYSGVCFYQAASLDRAVQQFRKGLAKAESTGSPLKPWLAFSAAYLFQSRGYQDSAVAYYRLAQQSLGEPSGTLRIRVLNNVGVALEVLKDTAAAGTALRQALALTDSAADPKTARLVRDNLGRLSR